MKVINRVHGSRTSQRGPLRSSLALAATAVLLVSGVAPASAGPQSTAHDSTYFAAPEGRDEGSCKQKNPCSLIHVKDVVQKAARKGKGDVKVVLGDGVYRISQPLDFRAEDGGGDGRTVRWEAAEGAHPVISGASPIGGWSVSDEGSNIYVAETPKGVDSRQLYVDKVIAKQASMEVGLEDLGVTADGLTIKNPNLEFLNDLPDQDRIEFEALGDFTNRYSPVESIADNMMTMAQPAWDNNTWGWDTFQNVLLDEPTWYLKNSLSFLDEAGEWYLDSDAHQLYYKPADGVDPNDLAVELPMVEALMSVGGTYDEPVQGLQFSGIEFTGTSWLGPSTHGYANQQNGTFIKDEYDYRPEDAFESCSRGCESFERARGNSWYQEPAAVQVSAASGVTFENNIFTNLGQTALGIGNDANATVSGVGLGASNISVQANIFNEVGGHGIVVGGVLPDAHHPSDERMVNEDIKIENNTINRVGIEYKDNSGILSTYNMNVQILNNEVSDVPYDGIDTGYGWGANDAGGSNEYERRGYYKWNPRYETPTTFKDNLVSSNLIHRTKRSFADGGTLYNLSASPGTVIERNYIFNVSGVGLYLDEGTRYTTYRENVLQGTNPWVFTNAYNEGNGTNDNLLANNWRDGGGAQIPNAEARNNRLIDNVQITGGSWPTGAQEVICSAGVAPEWRTALNANETSFKGCP